MMQQLINNISCVSFVVVAKTHMVILERIYNHVTTT